MVRDAIAGVVNIILRRSFDGVLLKGGYGISSRGDLPNRELSGTFGKKFDEGGFMFNASYRESGGNLIGDRPISRDPDWRSLGGRNFRDSAPTTATAFKGIDPTRPQHDHDPARRRQPNIVAVQLPRRLFPRGVHARQRRAERRHQLLAV